MALDQLDKKNLFKNPIYQEKINLPEISIDCFVDKENEIYKNILPPLSLLNKIEEKDLIDNLKDLDFTNKSLLAA